MRNKTLITFSILISIILTISCNNNSILIDKRATAETVALYKNLKKLSETNVLFGHQHATEYGHGWIGNDDRSDVKSVTGSHPAVIGIDLGHFTGREKNLVEKEKKRVRKVVQETYKRGGVITISWHFNNPVSNDGFYWNEKKSANAVKDIIPNGEYHEHYKEILSEIGEWANSCVDENGVKIPMIFRPYHEFDGDWFWWGKSHTKKEDFIALWRFTVEYLRDSLDVHNFIYAFSPDNRFDNEEEFLDRYPGNEWVDMVGTDNYGDLGRDGYKLDLAINKLRIITKFAEQNNKIAAFTETGLESIPDTTWWTDVLLKILKDKDVKMSYVLVWRNDSRSKTHYYAPFPGQVSEKNFIEFYNSDLMLFENDLNNIYK